MSSYRLFKHKHYDRSAQHLPEMIQRKAIWAQVLLGIRGRTPSVKGTTGLSDRWRRTPVQGNHYYMWWIPRSESSVVWPDQTTGVEENVGNTILIHSIRHHDETDDPIDPGSLDDYAEVAVASLDPRFDEQQEVSARLNSEAVTLATIKGLPGSGKTVSLLYLVRDLAQRPEIHQVLYITYTNRLKRAAHDFLQVQGQAVNAAVKICTLNEIEQEITGITTFSEPFSELRNFTTFLDLQNGATLGPWKKYPQTLYTELRAHVLGRTFPPGYALPAGQLNERLFRQDTFSAAAYAADRELHLSDAELAWRLADRLQDRSFFLDQRAAYQGIERLRKGKSPAWLADLDALVIDEVQDLTLLQIALLGELVRERMRRRPNAGFVFTVAGDESQIVQPSGFDWGITKDLLGEQVGIWPDEFEFQHQRRAPRNLAQLIDHTWSLYRHLPRSQRPSSRRQAFVYDDDLLTPADQTIAEHGQIFLCPPQPVRAEGGNGLDATWIALLDELASRPGRVLIDLTEGLRPSLSGAIEAGGDEIIFLPREIKGLERATVVVYGLNAVYERALRLCHETDGGNIPKFEARRLFDEVRVALSRSTGKLILLEPATAPVLAELSISHVAGTLAVAWADLVELLQLDEMSEIEAIEGYLDEVDDLFANALWEQGYRRNRRGYDLAVQLGDHALQRDAQAQFIDGHIQEADSFLQQDQWQQAYARNRIAHQLATAFGDPLLEEQVEDQAIAIGQVIAVQVRRQLVQAQEQLQQHQFKPAYQTLSAARSHAELIFVEPSLAAELDEAQTTIAWQWAGYLIDGDYTEADAQQAATLLIEAARAMARQSDGVGASALHLLAERYTKLPQHKGLTASQLEILLTFAGRYLGLLRPLNLDQNAYIYVRHWLEETFASLHQQTDLYYRWALVGQEFADLTAYPALDDHLWDLENRLALLVEQGKRKLDDKPIAKFRALVTSYNGNLQEASVVWEQLGELEVAADYARDAGDMERAYNLLRQAKAVIPEELAVAVKALRLLQQLEQKHHALRPGEREQLLEELAALHTAIAGSETATGEDDLPA